MMIDYEADPTGGPRLRVHFVTVGSHHERMVTPLTKLRADVALFVTKRRNDSYKPHLDKAMAEARKVGINADVLECDIWDAPTVVDLVGGVVTASPRHHYFFNVSTGAKPACLAGSIASMFFPVHPYYQPLEYEERLGRAEYEMRLKEGVQFLPTFKAPSMRAEDVQALQFISRASAPVRKMNLIAHLKEVGAIAPKARTRVSSQAYHAQTDVILTRLSNWGFVRLVDRGKRLRISVTDLGMGGGRMFGHVLRPKIPLEILRA